MHHSRTARRNEGSGAVREWLFQGEEGHGIVSGRGQLTSRSRTTKKVATAKAAA
jgi:hypothetical protein